MADVLGIVDLVWRNQRLAVKEGAKVKLGGIVGKAVVAGRTVHNARGYEASEVTATFALERGMSLLAIFAAGQGPMEVLTDIGTTYSWTDAFVTNRPEATSGEGGDVEIHLMAGVPNEVL